jgi:hypothetical protein
MIQEAKVFWTCKYCGGDTSHVEADYLWGYDHLACALQEKMQEEKKAKQVLTIPFDLILSTPNDQELGEKIRVMYHEAKNNS